MAVLAAVRSHVGRTYKAAVRAAWMDGIYARDGLGSWANQLQRIRNVFGPSWLDRVKASDMAAAADLPDEN